MSNQTLVSPDVAVGEQVQVECASGSGVKFIRVIGETGGSGSIIGTARKGNASVTEDLTDAVLVPAGTTVEIYRLTQDQVELVIASGMTVVCAILVNFFSTNNAWFGSVTKLMRVHNRGGIIQTPNGGTSDADITPDTADNVSPELISTAAHIVIDAGNLALRVTAPSDVDIYVWALPSFTTCAFPVPLPPPATISALSVTHGPDSGGTTTEITGTHLTGSFRVTLSAADVTSFVVADDDHLSPVVSGPGSPGVGDVVVSTPAGDATLPNAWTYDAATPLTICGGPSIVKFWGQGGAGPSGSSIQETAGLVTGVNDLSGNNQHSTVFGTPAFVASSPNITPTGPTVQLSGVAEGLSWPAFALDVADGSPLFFMIVCRQQSNGGTQILVEYDGGNRQFIATNTGVPVLNMQGGTPNPTYGTSILNAMVAVTGSTGGGASPGQIQKLAVSNTAEVTETVTPAAQMATPGQMAVGVFPGDGTSEASQLEFVCLVVLNIDPPPTMRAQLETWAQTEFGVP
jgi:hypothetical protein